MRNRLKQDVLAAVAFLVIMTSIYLALTYYFQNCQTIKDKFPYMQAPARCIR